MKQSLFEPGCRYFKKKFPKTWIYDLKNTKKNYKNALQDFILQFKNIRKLN